MIMEENHIIFVSIVLSTYNDERYIRQSIQSVLIQTYPYFEFIIINDGSTDNTLSIINEFVDSRIVLVDKVNTGLIDSLNIGFSKAKYDWVMRMDGDDICMPNRLQKLVEALDDDYAVIGSECELINGEDETIGYTWLKYEHKDIVWRLRLQLPNIIHPSTIINKRYFENIGGYDRFIQVAEDYDLWLRLSKLGLLGNVKHKLLKYRIHKFNISNIRRRGQYLNTQIAYYKFRHNINLIYDDLQYERIRKYIEKNKFFKVAEWALINIGISNIFKARIYKFIFQIFNQILKFLI
jgi:glycosyltransferase involved in cell wall biosynthesis